jgi:hypothetical protein
MNANNLRQINMKKITAELLIESGFELIEGKFYYNEETGITVKIVFTKTGKHFFTNNGAGVKYMEDLLPGEENQNDLLNKKAFKGDALINFFAREMIADKFNKLHKKKEIEATKLIVSNQFLKAVCISIDLHPENYSKRPHDYGTTYEARVYDIYIEKGFSSAFDFFIETALAYYNDITIGTGKSKEESANLQ